MPDESTEQQYFLGIPLAPIQHFAKVSVNLHRYGMVLPDALLLDAIRGAQDGTTVTLLQDGGEDIALIAPARKRQAVPWPVQQDGISVVPAPCAFTPEEIYQKFREHVAAGMIEYVLPTDPLGERWVIGHSDGTLENMDGAQACAWLFGANAVLMMVSRVMNSSRSDLEDLRGRLAARGSTPG